MLIVLLTLLLLAYVIWMFEKKIESIKKKIQAPVTWTIDSKEYFGTSRCKNGKAFTWVSK